MTLFDDLVDCDALITYAGAWRTLFPDSKDPQFYNLRHGPSVVAAIEATPARVVCGLRIRLDALVVYKATGEPSDEHFTKNAAFYTREQWRTAFSGWDVRSRIKLRKQ